MPQLRGGDWIYDQGELPAKAKDPEIVAENKPGHRPLDSYSLPKWVYHPDAPSKRIVVEKADYYGLATDGNRNWENWNVAHVAAFHDDLKLLSLATLEQCKEPNRWGMTPTHMTGMGQHVYGPSLNVLFELVQMGAADPEAANSNLQTPWHVCQRMHKPNNLKKFEKVLLKGAKPDNYDIAREQQLRLRGKFAFAGEAEEVTNVCLVFPGQGAQAVGMMKELQHLASVKDMISRANAILGYDILDLMLNGPDEKLNQTKYCQPAMYLAGLAAVEQLKIDDPGKVQDCKAVAGLSLGEYTALAVAGVFDFETGMRLVKERGEAMDFETTREGAPKQAMVSVAGLSEDVIENLCREVQDTHKGQVCKIANYLFSVGFSIAGHEDAVKALQEKAEEAGALQVRLLKTSGAFHTPLMQGAKDHLLAQLNGAKASMAPPRCAVYMNTTGEPLAAGTSVDEIIGLLGEQLVSPVRWTQCMHRALEDGMTDFIECGPGKQLKAMMKRLDQKAWESMTNVPA